MYIDNQTTMGHKAPKYHTPLTALHSLDGRSYILIAMKKILLRGLLPAGLWLFAAQVAHAQLNLSFAVNQPDNPLTADAGPDQVYDGSSAVVLGGTPAATGGFGDYSYQWEPAAYLDDPNAANPTVTNLDSPVTFTLTVSDPGALCEKQAAVFVDYLLGTHHAGAPEARAFPNPFTEHVRFESSAPIIEIVVTDMTGQSIAAHRNLNTEQTQIDSAPLAVGMYFFIIRFADGSTTVKKLCKVH